MRKPSLSEYSFFEDFKVLPNGWKKILSLEVQKSYFKKLTEFLAAEEKKNCAIYPKKEHILRAIQAIDLEEVRVVILGQDPYHGEGQAMGFSFAVPNAHFPKPPSLKNIFKEIKSDLNVNLNDSESDLSGWTAQNVLLLNTVLTVRAGAPLSHRGKGWEEFTDEVIRALGERAKPIVFLLWGSSAIGKKKFILPHHFILESVHPSPLSAYRGFLGNKHFSKCNDFLRKRGEREINWAQVSV